ncbi:MAG: hypothetical protein CMA58_01935, partial [Euryarchaeota archaeon]|nr:hypothetical protein [Euryarchaeota archaeon]
TTHENYESNESDCEAAGHVWMEDEDHDDHDDPTPQEIIDSFDSNNDSKLSWDEFWLHIEEDEHDGHDDHNETDDHDDHNETDDHDEEEALMELFNASDNDGDGLLDLTELDYFIHALEEHDEHEEEEALMELFNASDNDGDGLLDLAELDHFIHVLEDHDEHEGVCHNTTTHENYESNESDCEAAGHVWMEDDDHDDHDDHNETDEHDEHAVGYVSIHIEAEGDYGFALPMDVEFYILSEDSHEGHDHHGHDEDGHDEDGHDEDGHDEDGHDEDGTIDAGDDDSFMYDPHSWLDPVAFAAQVDVVLEKLILTFPNGTSNFTENANSYKVQLQDLDDKYEAAFGDAGTCFVGGHEKTIVANHNAYSYISARYDIEIITLYGLDPEGEPSPEDIIGVINHIAENNITVLFIEEFTSQTAVNSIVEDTGVVVNTLYTMEMAPSNNDDNYMTMMNKNLNNIVNGIGC